MSGCSGKIERLRAALQGCDAVVIGAGAGLSTAAGFTYDGARFREHFADFEEKYGFHDMYSGGFYPFATEEERWAFWSRSILLNRYQDAPKPVYHELRRLVRGKDYFVLTTNVDHQFQKAGFDKKRLFYTQGDYGLWQCSEPCCQETFDNEAAVRQMAARQENMRVPSELVPHCPHCGRPMAMNLRCDDTFVQDEGWHRAAERYANFLRTRAGEKLLFWELGVGYNTPGDHQISLLADDGAESPRHLCLRQSGAGGLPWGDRRAVHLHRRGHRGYSATAVSAAEKTDGASVRFLLQNGKRFGIIGAERM